MKPSRITSKYQTTIPTLIREHLDLKRGDAVIFDIQNGQVIVRKAAPLDLEYAEALSGTLNEWGSEHDEEAYGNL
jgi:AbrB family looped-hinge helix DNA binding protein